MGSRGDIGVSKKMGVGLLGGVYIRESLSAISEIPEYPTLERAYIFGAPKGVGFRGGCVQIPSNSLSAKGKSFKRLCPRVSFRLPL